MIIRTYSWIHISTWVDYILIKLIVFGTISGRIINDTIVSSSKDSVILNGLCFAKLMHNAKLDILLMNTLFEIV